jgi:hypothetical protein
VLEGKALIVASPLFWSYDDTLRKEGDIMPDQDLKDKVRRVRKEGRLKVQSKAEALELITYAQIMYGYQFRIEGHTSFYYLVIDGND